ncbi:hypothetical protein OIN60_11080 [Paenibacillus sp. P96]|uniref:Uncharacterized protein n=1 Tax=Paenibacillus zeirhizosphaerae TaxID=2987519 RepID=A0ABT9FRM0_9BACL|nr:hypothetical protein [Paenibacillus sp. P96]MDP4097314.1 hypothetical protein [Paenibacillus sp. P96]
MTYAFRIEPAYYISFENEDELLDKCKTWGLLSDKATKLKTFYYKGNGLNIPCELLGYVDDLTAVIQLDNGQKHCIHPSYLKEMQASAYNIKTTRSEQTGDDESSVAGKSNTDKSEAVEAQRLERWSADASDSGIIDADIPAEMPKREPDDSPLKSDPEGLVDENDAPEDKVNRNGSAKSKSAKDKTPKLDLPEDKVLMMAVVKEFTTIPNHFSDNDDEVIIYEHVKILEPEMMEIGAAWSSNSATMKKHELAEGDVLTFDAKIIKKKLVKHPVPYKINSPSKIKKE